MSGAVEKMFLDDFARLKKKSIEDLKGRPLWFKVVARAAYLTAPIQ